MYPQLHIPDGFLSPQISLLLWVATAVLIGIAVRKTSRTDVRLIASQPILMGVLGAFIFAAQMINFPVAAGTSGHLLGGALAAILIGPYAATLSITIVLLLQALLFADGGLIASGLNVFNLALVGVWGSHLIFLLLRKVMPDSVPVRVCNLHHPAILQQFSSNYDFEIGSKHSNKR